MSTPAPAVGGAPALAGGLATAPPAVGPQTPSIGSEDRPVRTVSLRARVVLAVLILLTVVLVLLGVVVTTMLGNSLREDLRQRLQDRAGYAVVLQQQGVTGQTLADQMSGGGMSSSFAAGGVEFVGRADADPLGPPGGPAAGTPPGSAPPLPQPAAEPAVLFSESDGLLTAEVTLPDGILRLQAGENDIDRTLSALRTIEVVAGVAALLVTGLLLIRLVAVALAHWTAWRRWPAGSAPAPEVAGCIPRGRAPTSAGPPPPSTKCWTPWRPRRQPPTGAGTDASVPRRRVT